MNSSKIRNFAKSIYHLLPLSQQVKWRLREKLRPLLSEINATSPSIKSLAKSLYISIKHPVADQRIYRDELSEWALAVILHKMQEHSKFHGHFRHWIALPFLATGGAERVALNFCKAIREFHSNQSVLLITTDRKLLDQQMVFVPDYVLIISLDDYLQGDLSYERKKALLNDLIASLKPYSFHNINSEVAWSLILDNGEEIKKNTNIYASIFAFQFSSIGGKKIGYAASYLKKGLPYLTGLISDNKRFINDAVIEYEISFDEAKKMHCLYQPCRLFDNEEGLLDSHNLASTSDDIIVRARPKILWAGRLDQEKRIDLFFDVVRACKFADFIVYGKIVVENELEIPVLENLIYEGAFSSPFELIEKHKFDAFIFTSRWEGMPNVLLEVGVLGIPIISPTVGGIGELIDSSTGFPLRENPIVQDYKGAIEYILNHKVEALNRSNHLFEKIKTQHSWGSFKEALKNIPNYLESNDTSGCVEDSEKNSPVVSIIIPCFNQGIYLRECVESVLADNKLSLELIVVNDGSTDPKTDKYLQEVKSIYPSIVKIINQSNQGLSAARNTGLKAARGRYIQFLDSDDLIAPGKIDAQVAHLELNQSSHVSVCNFLLCDAYRSYYSKPEEAIANFQLTKKDFLYNWERGFSIPIHCGLFKKSILLDNEFDTASRAKEDWIFWSSLAIKGAKFSYINGHWAFYRQHPGSMRRSQMNMGRAWISAGLKLDAMIGKEEPLFFESVMSWFEQCYRSTSGYREEVASLHCLKEKKTEKQEKSFDYKLIDDIAFGILNKINDLNFSRKNIKLSVIVPIFNHFDYLEQCLSSLGNQKYRDFEIICVDDNSTDVRVKRLLEALSDKNPNLKIIINSKNTGISNVQNIAVDNSIGDFVAFLDCDDYLDEKALLKVAEYLSEKKDVDYLFTDRKDVDKDGNLIRVAHYGGYDNIHYKCDKDIVNDLLDGMVASHLKVIRREAYIDVGGCGEEFTGIQDWELALKMSDKYSFGYLDEPVYNHRIHLQSVTNSQIVSQLMKTNIVRRKFALKKANTVKKSSNFQELNLDDIDLSLDFLKKIWQNGKLIKLNILGEMSVEQCNFIREFNSYFEEIRWNSPTVPCSLYGYLWDRNILKRIIDLEYV